jgi:hypothetical protein
MVMMNTNTGLKKIEILSLLLFLLHIPISIMNTATATANTDTLVLKISNDAKTVVVELGPRSREVTHVLYVHQFYDAERKQYLVKISYKKYRNVTVTTPTFFGFGKPITKTERKITGEEDTLYAKKVEYHYNGKIFYDHDSWSAEASNVEFFM